jgi:hypothetical protein
LLSYFYLLTPLGEFCFLGLPRFLGVVPVAVFDVKNVPTKDTGDVVKQLQIYNAE